MLSRTAFLAAKPTRSLVLFSRATQTSAPALNAAGTDQKVERRVRPEFGGKVRMGFIPESWFEAFYSKTGVTGPYVFGASVATYLLSKEIYVLEHEFYTGLSILIMIAVAQSKFGDSMGKYLDKEVDAVEKGWTDSRQITLDAYKKAIEEEKKEQLSAEGQSMLMAAKRENVALQLESAFRERAMMVYKEVKRRLDYQVEKQNVERRINQKHMVNWVVDSVLKSISPEQQVATLQKCIDDLGALAATHKA